MAGRVTYAVQAGELKKGAFVMLKTRPCQVIEITTASDGGKKVQIKALDIFTSKEYVDEMGSAQNIDVPYVKKNEYDVLSADPYSGEVSLGMDDGSTKDDQN